MAMAKPIKTKGLVFVDSPGYDPVSITGEVASGCNVVCFTTGRGSCYGNKPAPSIKIASNTPMYEHMREDMDLNLRHHRGRDRNSGRGGKADLSGDP